MSDGLRSFLERRGVAASGVWGFAEATLFFFVPDIVVGATAMVRPRAWWRAALAAVGGALLGGLVLFLVARAAGAGIRGVIDAIPGIPASMIERVQAELASNGPSAMVLAPLDGIPYKIHVTEWSLRGGDLGSLLLWTVPARALRIVPAGLLAAAAGHVLRRPIARRPWLWLALYALAWAGVYTVYFAINGLW